MAQVIGLGVFYTAQDPAAVKAWYLTVLGLEMEDWGGTALLPEPFAAKPGAASVLSVFKTDTTYIAPSTKPFMLNLVVDDLDGMLQRAAAAGVTPTWISEADPSGRFAHLLDPEGVKIELWEPAAP
ncbi:MAG: VOC family protein [Caulobacterales bacterium]|jgi:predicted enzyme related to lactoylglutathione lyase